ncbi:outer membrane beta-barrel protein [Helicobacter sp. 23-1044]
MRDSAPKITKKNVKRIAKKNAEIKLAKQETSGFFLGFGGTLANPSATSEYSRKIRVYSALMPSGYWGANYVYVLWGTYYPANVDGGFEALLGYKHFANPYFGVRSYLDYNARFLDLLHSHNFTANFDMLINFVTTKPLKVGFVLGFGYGLVYERVNSDICKYFNDCNIIGETMQGNFGVRFVIYNNSAIEVLFQPRYSGRLLTELYKSSYGTNRYELLNEIKEVALIGTLRFVYTF